MEKIRVAINGFGRIGRYFLKQALNSGHIEIVAVNDLASPKTLAHLFKYDSVHGRYAGLVSHDESGLIIDGFKIPVYNQKDAGELPWGLLNVHTVVESTGQAKTSEKATLHLKAGARRVIISAPADDDTPTVVMGVNNHVLTGSESILSNASCTTNNAAPMIKIIDEICGVESGFITTVHSYTSDQRLHDAPHSDLRRARAAAVSMIPTTTGAAKAITRIFPDMDGKFGGAGIRVPVPNGSMTDLTCVVRNVKTADEINAAFKRAASGSLAGILEYTEDPIVSVDIIGNPHSCIFDAQLTSVVDRMVKVVGWYDNEAGYSTRLCDLIIWLAER
jgi:glyceraldehyde 3-phosphate dehydrogenase